MQIGTQLWMAENLRTTRYNDGTRIPQVQGSTWDNISTHGYCWYKNNYKTFGKIYGALYNGFTIETGKICPTGWHVPDDTEWTVLQNYLGGENSAGGALKETGTGHWKSPNTSATDSLSFSAIPGGARWTMGQFALLGQRGYWWSTSPFDMDFDASIWMIQCDDSCLKRVPSIKGNGFSVRCVKD